MQIRYSPSQTEYPTLSTEQLRASFLVESLFRPGQVELVYTDADRGILGSALPTDAPLKLTADAELRAAFFCERRELGILNLGGAGTVTVDGRNYEVGKLDCLYVGRGSREIVFSSREPASPAAFYLLSYPAHAVFPTTLARQADAAAVELGTAADANRRTIYKYIHPGGIKSCQLVMGFTRLAEGAVWNTMPPHTHTRRSEIYIYFDLGPDRRVMHFMGTPQQTRHLVVADRQAVISPSWSIHCGCGTGAYTFCWGMGGENQAFDDMDAAPLASLR
ncbi:MAG TPA: 5-dehydro-4-deoxy-D-glucuronate isomerase [Verrucomicrobiota bacterium]|jgi:4-deoxy-L-threo-5-hexosulose-uronate ketol-isomerase|nr:5-dehydro-4-deoxy-D-glucuronate isomerase [Verrucomicrobiota bacterium]HRT06957.1 5-dehydro-4-deoxy-D-glucuronate isomerase [Candidatus Paceibacterota bacterium]HRT56906.1 5-dehydro-4-deoxy-D-glucuronate isomerase [Candidatus Paceibacterota bacterium]